MDYLDSKDPANCEKSISVDLMSTSRRWQAILTKPWNKISVPCGPFSSFCGRTEKSRWIFQPSNPWCRQGNKTYSHRFGRKDELKKLIGCHWTGEVQKGKEIMPSSFWPAAWGLYAAPILKIETSIISLGREKAGFHPIKTKEPLYPFRWPRSRLGDHWLPEIWTA